MRIKSYGVDTTFNARERFFEVQPNAVGILIALDSYEKLKSSSAYTATIKEVIPEMDKLSACTIADNTDANGMLINHTVTITTPFNVTADMIAYPDDYAICLYNKGAITAAKTSGDFATLASPENCAVLSIKNASTIFTSGSTVSSIDTEGASQYSSNFTDCVLLPNDGYIPLAQLSDFTMDKSAETISTDNQHSGGYKSTIPGLKSADPSSISGIYCALFPSVKTLESAAQGDQSVYVRLGSMKAKYGTYATGYFKVSNFSTTGTTDGSNRLDYSCDMALQNGTFEEHTIV